MLTIVSNQQYPPYPPHPPYPIPPKYPSDVLLAIAELTEIFVARMDKPIVAAINIGSLRSIIQNYSSWYIRDVQQQSVRI
ncbi:MAG TPA: hypothetical protein VEL11_12610 [Candidatus Bathyarchaeia archaeon]|nr:hypothetical protein [Candidatus Bathyarchaeia archaeon]